MVALLFFIIVAFLISYIDIKKGFILDKITFPAILTLGLIKYFDNSLDLNTIIAIVIISILFVIPIVLNMAFGGGDLRFGLFSALFLGLEPLGYFILFSGLFHLVLLSILKKKSFAFAPAMSAGAIAAYIVGKL